ncbi:hypothetical protein B0H13DRAFT_1907257 [Mycena leptocephala]|nr:hypothetical protein B0H13DRAFT_1907257 [Mycena leptocephala]
MPLQDVSTQHDAADAQRGAFSAWELLDFDLPATSRPVEVIETGVSIEALFQQALADADMHANHLDEGIADDEDDEWEDDEVTSTPPSPPSSPSPQISASSSASSRAGSPSPLDPTLACASTSAPTSSMPTPPPDPAPPHRRNQRPPPDPDAPPEIERHRRNQRAAYRRAKRRQKARQAQGPYDRKPDPRYTQTHREERHFVAFDLEDTSYSTGGWAWLGRRSKKATGRLRTFEELKRDGARLLEWNGRDPKLIVDCQGRIIAILLGTPEDPDWPGVMKDAIAWLRASSIAAVATSVITAGVSFGGGQMRPGNLSNSHFIRRLIRMLLRRKSIRRIIGFQSSGMAFYAPKPLPVTSLGDFDHKKGAHLYMKQLDLIVEFPPNATILIPSGFRASPRYSITQFAAGGLFRWVAYGFQTVKSLLSKPGGKQLRDQFDGVPGSRWEMGVGPLLQQCGEGFCNVETNICVACGRRFNATSRCITTKLSVNLNRGLNEALEAILYFEGKSDAAPSAEMLHWLGSNLAPAKAVGKEVPFKFMSVLEQTEAEVTSGSPQVVPSWGIYANQNKYPKRVPDCRECPQASKCWLLLSLLKKGRRPSTAQREKNSPVGYIFMDELVLRVHGYWMVFVQQASTALRSGSQNGPFCYFQLYFHIASVHLARSKNPSLAITFHLFIVVENPHMESWARPQQTLGTPTANAGHAHHTVGMPTGTMGVPNYTVGMPIDKILT